MNLTTMNQKQRIAFWSPPVLIGSSYLYFHLLVKGLGERPGWFIGLALYWLVWCGAFSWWLVGRDRLLRFIRPRQLTRSVALLLIVPIVGSLSYKLIPGMDYGQESFWLAVMMFSSVLGNGIFEEILWRGVYLVLFPRTLFYRILWPGLWFALWHFVPGSVSPDGNVVGLMVGSGFFGLYLGFLAWRTNTIWWCIVAHVLGGLIMAA
jgi:membrane protease YdiL (CAAX protease family)